MSITQAELFRHPSGDTLLTAVGRMAGAVAELVRAFPGPDVDDATWLEDWFRRRIRSHIDEAPAASPEAVVEGSEVDLPSYSVRVAVAVRLLSVQPHYFRGFRAMPEPVLLSDALVVIDGSNSSGKTSLAEALEWLFTGELLRRSRGDLGNPSELENCITNAFRPEGETTWVEAVFEVDGNREIRLRRELIADYGAASTSRCVSKLLCDGNELDGEGESDILGELFEGVPPILMQHSLRLFVHDAPAKRREYFERLLQLNGLTQLIAKAAIGKASLANFPSPTGGGALAKWQKLKTGVTDLKCNQALRNAEKALEQDRRTAIEKALIMVAASEFGESIQQSMAIGPARAIVELVQQKVRQQSFPLLKEIRPERTLDAATLGLLSSKELLTALEVVETAETNVGRAFSAASAITDAQIAVATAFEELELAGLIEPAGTSEQICPLCEYDAVSTLTRGRSDLIREWLPAREAVKSAERIRDEAVRSLKATLTNIRSAYRELIPSSPTEDVWEAAIVSAPTAIADAARSVRAVADLARHEIYSAASDLDDLAARQSGELPQNDDIVSLAGRARRVADALNVIVEQALVYADGVAALEKAIGTEAKGDAIYDRRQVWLDLANDVESLAEDFAWEQAKALAQSDLDKIREKLKEFRQALLDSRRGEFSTGISSVWQILREDLYSGFSRLHIPEPSKKGFPVEIQVKATLDNGSEQCEVDALRVFSESQVHVLGIAAFVTRAKLLGHRVLIFDDPVQSMDEDHFKSFAGPLLTHLLDEGFQVIVLTHNYTFVQEVSVAQTDRDEYVSMRIAHNQTAGCYVEDGTRRLSERLKRAEQEMKRGDMGAAWKSIRYAVERLCVMAHKKHGPEDFDPAKRIDHRTQLKIEDAVGDLLDQYAAGWKTRLAAIKKMSAGGTHDIPAEGQTECRRAIRDINNFADALGVKDGRGAK